MKKKILSLALCAAGVAAANMFTACGDSTPASQISTFIAEAEQSVPLEASPCLGNIPSLQLQYKEAGRLLEEKVEQRKQEAEEKFKSGGSMEDAIRQSEIISDERKAMEKELKQVFTERIMAEAKKLEGRAIPCDADGVQFSKATGKLVCAKDSSIYQPLYFEAEVVLETPFKGYTAFCSWEYQDAQGQIITAGAVSQKEWKGLKAGDKFTLQFPVGINAEQGKKLSKFYFKQ